MTIEQLTQATAINKRMVHLNGYISAHEEGKNDDRSERQKIALAKKESGGFCWSYVEDVYSDKMQEGIDNLKESVISAMKKEYKKLQAELTKI